MMNNLYEYIDPIASPYEAFCSDSENAGSGLPIPAHWHYYAELLYILEGRVRISMENAVKICGEDTVILFPPRCVHGIDAFDKSERVRYYVVKFDSGNLPSGRADNISLRSSLQGISASVYPCDFAPDKIKEMNLLPLFEEIVKEYREAYGIYAVNGILFNHESERRGENFVTRKITLAAGRIAEGLQEYLELGNLDSLRDWGYAKDYVECMWMMLQHEKPEDFVIATGMQHTVRDFAERAFAANGMQIRWEGTGVEEKGYDRATGKMLIRVNPAWIRPTDVDNLWGDPTKAKTLLGWNPQKTSYDELVRIMAGHDREIAKKEAKVKRALEEA